MRTDEHQNPSGRWALYRRTTVANALLFLTVLLRLNARSSAADVQKPLQICEYPHLFEAVKLIGVSDVVIWLGSRSAYVIWSHWRCAGASNATNALKVAAS